MKPFIVSLVIMLSAPNVASAQERMRMWCFGILVQRCVSDAQPRTTVKVCPTISHWDAAYQSRLVAARRKANDPDITAAIREAINLRDQARACRGST